MKTLKVIAPPGKICPMEGGKRAGIITDKKAVTVKSSAYYRRLIKEGSLLDTDAKKAEKTGKATAETASKGSK